MANQAGASLHGVAFRAVALNANGSHAGNLTYTTDNLVKFDFNAEIEAGTEVSDKNAAGTLYVAFKLQDIVKRLTTVIEIVTDDPQLEAILTGGTVLVTGGSGAVNVQGYQYPPLGAIASPNGIGLEIWTHNIVANQINVTQPYQRWIFPRGFFHKSNRTIDINRMANPFDGFNMENTLYGTGPAGDIPISTTAVAQWFYDTTLPTVGIGYSTATA